MGLAESVQKRLRLIVKSALGFDVAGGLFAELLTTTTTNRHSIQDTVTRVSRLLSALHVTLLTVLYLARKRSASSVSLSTGWRRVCRHHEIRSDNQVRISVYLSAFRNDNDSINTSKRLHHRPRLCPMQTGHSRKPWRRAQADRLPCTCASSEHPHIGMVARAHAVCW